jgi:hypothetical protein
MERHSIFYPRLSEDERKRNTKILGRLAGDLARKFDKNDVQDVIAADTIDVETILLLHKFQTAYIAGVTSPSCYVGKEYETYRRSIGRIGPVFEALGLAKRLPGSVLGWTPTKKLGRIISARWRLQKFRSGDINKVNKVIIRTVLEVARVSRFIVKVLSAHDVKKDRIGRWKLSPELHQLLIATSVKRTRTYLKIADRCRSDINAE